MYRPPAYAVNDVAHLHAMIRGRRFATIAAVVPGGLQFAYAPVLVDPQPPSLGTLRFHVARANPLAEADGLELHVSFLGPDAYVSPDWYESAGFVPTWNYIAVEGSGRARQLDEPELRHLLSDLSAVEEERLRPKPPWTMDKVPEERMASLLGAIRGFAVTLDRLQGKFKLSQDKSPGNIAGVIAGLEAREDPASHAVAQAMRQIRE